jgi:tRNA (guanine26-N2/guanine27-N2)-dimethyltransferase|uniref:tRNA (guanine(26)-N(2))-dimethyltransferase n=1 Tax=Fervidicoccus fontis TaxID=683846 RepID=A0A7J3SKC2_9CREN
MREEVAREGLARFYIPVSHEYMRSDGKIEPSWMPVFYNPYSQVNRDLTVLALRAHMKLGGRIRTFVEPLAGSCVRSIRVLLESLNDYGIAYASDISQAAVELCKRNIELNDLNTRIFVEKSDARLFLLKLDSNGVPVDSIDIDPYGSPIYYLDAAIKSVGKEAIVSVTATDLGALSGRYKDVGLRRYSAYIYPSEFSKEIGARVLMGAFVKVSSYLERSAEPLMTFYHEHFLKAIFKIKRDRRGASNVINDLGFMCLDKDGNFKAAYRIGEPPELGCFKMVGPLWLGELWDESFIDAMMSEGKQLSFLSGEALKSLEVIYSEMKVKALGYYDIHHICSRLKLNVPSFSTLIKRLNELGYKASRTHFDRRGIRTNAPIELLEKIIKSLSQN